MSCTRFEKNSCEDINDRLGILTPANTVKSNKSSWNQFEEFCRERGYVIDKKTSMPKLAEILKDFAFNMKKQDGSNYKEGVIKTQWNRIAKILQQKFYKEFNITFDPFKDIVFQSARNARDAKRKELQVYSEKRKVSATIFSAEDHKNMIDLWDENTPDGLQRKFYHIAAYELAWRGGEATNCLTTFFNQEFDTLGNPTTRLIYNPVFSKTSQGGAGSLTENKWLTENKEEPGRCPVRLFRKLLEKRGKHVTTNRLFLTVNLSWKQSNSVGWYKNMPIGKNFISKWTSTAAKLIGIDVKRHKVTNHSNRSTAVSNLAKSGVGEHQIAKMTGHSSITSINSYLKLDKDHHQTLVTKLRNPKPIEAEPVAVESRDESFTSMDNRGVGTANDNSVKYYNCTFHCSNCHFSK